VSFALFKFQSSSLSDDKFLRKLKKKIQTNFYSCVFVSHNFLNFIYSSLKTLPWNVSFAFLVFPENICEQALSLMSKSAACIDTDVIQEIVIYSCNDSKASIKASIFFMYC